MKSAGSNPAYAHSPLSQAEGMSDIELELELELEASGTARKIGSAADISIEDHKNDRGFCLSRPIPTRLQMACVCFVLFCACFIILLSQRKDGPFVKKNRIYDDTDPINNAEAAEWTTFSATSPGLGVVATDSKTCSEIGVSLLKIGGNAVDAAVASALCLGVVSPGSSGLGGGAYILFHNSTSQSTIFYDSRETAPAASNPRMFDADPLLSQDGGLAVATLGELKGLYELHRHHGRLSWAACTEASAKLAEDYEVSAELAAMLLDDSVLPHLLNGNYKQFSKLFLNANGKVKQEGERVQNVRLAETLRKIGEQGSDYLYKTLASVLAFEVQAEGGVLHESDIRNYSVTESNPISASIMGHTIFTASGSSSGGAALAGIIEFMDGFPEPLASEGLVYNHRLVEAFKNVFAIRMSLGDPAFVNTTGPISALTSRNYIGSLRARVNDAHVLPLSEYGGLYNIGKSRRFLPADHGTSHLSVIDVNGNAVSLTSTVNTYFGSKIVSAATGIVFNNQMVSS
jgi:gamma-glutamyltranspeptidase/glutathione hydrolase/leukotriene-C4 hydrolase